jgi:hypothetical protein
MLLIVIFYWNNKIIPWKSLKAFNPSFIILLDFLLSKMEILPNYQLLFVDGNTDKPFLRRNIFKLEKVLSIYLF